MRATMDMAPDTARYDGLETLARRVPAGLLIATDGRPAADSAIIVGRSIAKRDGERHELVAVEQLERIDDDRRAATMQQHELPFRLAQQRSRTTDVAVDSWPLSIAYGRPASTIADLASFSQRRLIVVGLHVHSLADRLLRRETVLQVMQRASCPVLAVDSNRRTIPRRTLLAIDFSPSSIAAAREALRVIGDTGPVYLAHVLPRVTVPFNGDAQARYEPDIAQRLSALRSTLEIPSHMTTRVVLLQGDPAKELMTFADQQGIELIATGTRGFSLLRGSVVGRVATALVRAARCSLLVVPPMA